MDQARVLAIEHARDNRDFYGRRYASRELVWEVSSQEESEDYYDIRLFYRPTEGFRGEPGLDQFTIDKTGPIRLRQVLQAPRPDRRIWQTRQVWPALTAIATMVIAAATVAGLFAAGVFSSTSPGPGPEAVESAITVPVTPNEPAKLVTDQGDVSVALPSGSVATAVELRYQQVADDMVPQLPTGYISSQKVFDLALVPEEGQAKGPVSLLKPITITVRLSTGDLSLAGGVASKRGDPAL